jgi:hypothetical protein
VEDVMRLELRYRSDIDLSQPAMQVEIPNHIARCLRDYPHGGEGVITLGRGRALFHVHRPRTYSATATAKTANGVSTPSRRTRSVCCARATSGHAVAPPSSMVNSRRSLDHLVGAGEHADRDGKRAFNIRAASLSFALLLPILLISRLA